MCTFFSLKKRSASDSPPCSGRCQNRRPLAPSYHLGDTNLRLSATQRDRKVDVFPLLAFPPTNRPLRSLILYSTQDAIAAPNILQTS